MWSFKETPILNLCNHDTGDRRTTEEVARRKVPKGVDTDDSQLGWRISDRDTETCERDVQVQKPLENNNYTYEVNFI